MFKPASRECATTQSMAAMTCDTSVLPWASASLMLTIREPGAMPRNRVLSVAYVEDVDPESRPAMMPAMCVPWPKVSRSSRVGVCDSSDRSGPMTSLLFVIRPSTGRTPESSNATSMPWPL